jgi:parallel beta-helix repeat protein
MRKNRSAGRRLRVEALEERRMLAVLIVDDDFAADDPDAGRFTTIQAAIDDASDGDKIEVRPGIYTDELGLGAVAVVDKQLEIEGPDPHLSDYLDPDKAAIIDPGLATGPSVGFSLQVDGIVIEGFTIRDSAGPDDGDPEGVIGIFADSAASGYTIEDNVFENNSVGIWLNTRRTSGDVQPLRTVVEDNVFQDNDRASTAINFQGVGILSTLGLENVVIEDNEFSGAHRVAAIAIIPDLEILQSGIEITDNEFEDLSGAGIIMRRVVESSIENNEFENVGTIAIGLDGLNDGVTIEGNEIENPEEEGIVVSNGIGANQNITIEDNEIEDAGVNGIRIEGSSMNIVEDNSIKRTRGSADPLTGNGIILIDADDNRIEDNKVKKSARNGIFVDEESTDNLLLDNLSKKNDRDDVGGVDYLDESTGAETAGTANTYRDNKGRTEDPEGLIDEFV